MYTGLRFWFVCVCVIVRDMFKLRDYEWTWAWHQAKGVACLPEPFNWEPRFAIQIGVTHRCCKWKGAEAGRALTQRCETCTVIIFQMLNSICSVMPFGCRTALAFLFCSLVFWQATSGLLCRYQQQFSIHYYKSRFSVRRESTEARRRTIFVLLSFVPVKITDNLLPVYLFFF